MKTLVIYVLLLIFSSLLLMKGVVPAWNKVHSDFANYYVSAKLISDKAPLENIYNNQWFQNKIQDYGIETLGKFSPFPPITSWVMLPLTPFEPLTAQRIFTIINLIFLAIGSVVLKKLINWPIMQCILFMLGCGLGLINNIAFGQVYLIMTVLIMISFLLFRNNQFLLAGVILGFFTSLKYFPVVIIAGFFLNGLADVHQKEKPLKHILSSSDLRVVFYAVSSFVVLAVFQYFYFGGAVIKEFIYSSFLPHLYGELSGQGLFSFHFQSWDNLFRNLFVYDPQFNPHPFLNWPQERVILKIFISIFILVPTTLVLIKFKSSPHYMRRSVFLSLPALAAIVLLPASATYHFILLISSLVLILQESYLDKKIKIMILITYGLIGLIPYGMAFRLGETWGLLFAYPRLWLVTILFILVLVALIKKDKFRII